MNWGDGGELRQGYERQLTEHKSIITPQTEGGDASLVNVTQLVNKLRVTHKKRTLATARKVQVKLEKGKLDTRQKKRGSDRTKYFLGTL